MKRITTFFLLLSIAIIGMAQKPNLEPQQDKKKPLWGYVNPQTNKWVVKPSYESAEPFKECADGKYRAKVTKKGLQGFLNPDGKPAGAGVVFESIESMMQGNNLIVTVKGKKGIINPDGVYLIKPEYTSFTPFDSEGYISELKGKKGVIGATGEVLIPAAYTSIDTSDDEVFIVNKGDKVGLISRNGELIIKPKEYTSISRWRDLWKIKKYGGIGLYDVENRKELVRPYYSEVPKPIFVGGIMVYLVQVGKDKWGVVNQNGEEVIECNNKFVAAVPELNAIAIHRDDWLVYRLWFPKEEIFLECDGLHYDNYYHNGPFACCIFEISEPKIYEIRTCPSGYYDGGPWYYKGLTPSERASLNDSFEKKCKVYKSLPSHKVKVCVDGNGNNAESNDIDAVKFGKYWLVRQGYKPSIDVYSEDRKFVKRTRLKQANFYRESNQDWVEDGNIILFKNLEEYEYIYCGNMLSFIKDEDKNLWLPMISHKPQHNANGYEQVIPYDGEGSVASVLKDDKWGFFEKDKEVIPCKFSSPIKKSKIEGYYEFGSEGKLGLMTEDGTQLLPEEYDSFEKTLNPDVAIVCKNGIAGLFDLKSMQWRVPLTVNYTDFMFKGDGNTIICKKENGGRVYLNDKYNTITPTPQIKIECWKDEVNFNPLYMNEYFVGVKVRVKCDFNKIRRYTVHCAAYDSNGRPAEINDYFGYHHSTDTQYIDKDDIYYDEVLNLHFRHGAFKNRTGGDKEMYFKVWVINEDTGKEIPITGGNKIWFTVYALNYSYN